MSNSDIPQLEVLAKAVSTTGLIVSADIVGEQDDYELVTYIDEVVVLDSMGQEVVSTSTNSDD